MMSQQISKLRATIMGIGLIAVAAFADGWMPVSLVISDAEARVGRPATPGSVAGVARRSTRRSIHRTSVYVATLPRGCSTIVIEGTTLQQCGSTYYQAHSGQYVVVNVD